MSRVAHPAATLALPLAGADRRTAAALSAIAQDGNNLWLGCDELVEGRVALWRVGRRGNGSFTTPAPVFLGDYVDLFAEAGAKAGKEAEADIEGLCVDDGYLWFVGSHGWKRKRPKMATKERLGVSNNPVRQAVDRLGVVDLDRNRLILGRLPLVDGQPQKTVADGRSAARLAAAPCGNVLLQALSGDPHLGPYLSARIPGKDNGFDIEGLAVRDDRILLGLRGPVLRGFAVILDLAIDEIAPGRLGLRPGLADGPAYRKVFLDLLGLGIRELCLLGDDLLILAGPTMVLDGIVYLFRVRDFMAPGGTSGTDNGDQLLLGGTPGQLGPIECLFRLHVEPGADYAEGIVPFDYGDEPGLLIVYDSPSDSRLLPDPDHPQVVLADFFRMTA
jgi:hypothetical protein